MAAIVWRSCWTESSCSVAVCAASRSPCDEEALDAAELRPQGAEPVGELILLRAELLGRVGLLDLLDLGLDLVAERGELGGEVLGRRRARRQRLDLVEEHADLLRPGASRSVASPPLAAAAAAPAAARGEKERRARPREPPQVEFGASAACAGL